MLPLAMSVGVQAARASVASAVSELVDVLPKLATCHKAQGFSSASRLEGLGSFWRSSRHVESASMTSSTPNVDAKNGIEADAAEALMKEARRAVIAARTVLF